jgi:membrane protein
MADKPTLYERLLRARKWFWETWGEEADKIYRRWSGRNSRMLPWIKFVLFLREVLREFYRSEGMSRASSLAYTTLLSLIPLVVAFSQVIRRSFARLFPNLPSDTDALLNLVLPYDSPQVAYQLARFAENAQAASTFGMIVFLFISFRLFMAVEGTINLIWKVSSARGYRQKLRAFTMLFFWGPLLIGLSFTTSAMLERNPYFGSIVGNRLTGTIVAVSVLFVAFTMLFWLVPSTRVNIRSAAAGAFVTALLFEGVRFGFGIYANYLFEGRLNVIYGAIGLAIIFLLALEMMWMIVLLGVQISYVDQNFEGILRATEQQLAEDSSLSLYFALRALIEVARRFDVREEAPSAYRLAEIFGATDHQMISVLRKLEDAQLVKEIGGDWTGFVPGCDPNRIRIDEVVKVMEGGYRAVPASELQEPEQRLIATLYSELEQCAADALGQRTVGQVVRELYGAPALSRTVDGGNEPLPGRFGPRG